MSLGVLEPGGVLSRALDAYEDRPGQRRMSAAVAGALDNRGVAVIEAETGTGKTLAYLLPAVMSGLRVVISTGTRALQDQLASSDLPLVAELLDEPFDHAVVKGTSNYLCRRRLAGHMLSAPPAQTAVLDEIDLWARDTPTGDRKELTVLGDSAPLWDAVSTGADGRLAARCPYFERCFVTQARRRAERAQLVIVNHHLFFADLALRLGSSDARVLPDYDAVIFDEAHLVESALTEHFARAVSTSGIARVARDVRELGARFGGALGQTLDSRASALESEWGQLAGAIRARLAATAGRRVLPDDLFAQQQVERAWYAVDDHLGAIAGALERGAEENEDTAGAEAGLVARRVSSRRDSLSVIADSSDYHYARFGETRGSNLSLKAAPIDVSELFRDSVIEAGPAVIMTSATLTCAGSFEHTRQRLGIAEDRADEVRIESPFDYQRQAILYIASDMPDPRTDEFPGACVARMAELIDITAGRTLVLFTSHRLLSRAAESLPEWLEGTVLVQGQAPPAQLLRSFRNEPESVLLATGTFWQGIDVPGDSLSQVIIDKLPFAPPDDPLSAARARICEERGQNAFTSYQLPEAVMTFRQGAGRLIRRRGDRGIISVLDRRLLERRYGQVFFESLPAMTRTASLERVRRFWDDV